MPKLQAIFFATFLLLNSQSTFADSLLNEAKIHSDSIDDICVKDDYIYSASFDGKIKRTNFKVTEVIGSHDDWVRAILCIDDNIISASNDGNIILWKDNQILRKVKAHDWWITDLAFDKNKIVSVSLDETVKVWSYPDLEKLYEYKIPGSYKHYSVTINKNIAYIGSTARISALNLNNFKWYFRAIPIANSNTIYAIVSHGDDTYLSDSGGNINLITANNKLPRIVISLNHFAIKALAVDNESLYCGNDAGEIYQVKLNDFKHPVLIQKSPQAVRSITIYKNILYAAYDKGIIRSVQITN